MLYHATLYPADPFALMRRLTEDLDRLRFDAPRGFPSLNIWQNDEAAAITAELPGVEPGGIDIEVKDNVLTLSGERRAPELPEGAAWRRRERAFGRFARAIRLNFRVDPEKVEARFADGVLRIAVGRPDEDRPRRIEIQGRPRQERTHDHPATSADLTAAPDPTPAEPRAEAERARPLWRPLTDMVETRDGVALMLEMPGVAAEDVDVSLERRVLTIRGRTRAAGVDRLRLVHREYDAGDYERAFTLSDDVDAGRIDAEMKTGVLTLRLPRSEAAQPRTIKVKAA